MVRTFREQDVFTMCYVHSAEHAAEMVKAGVDVVCAHVGGTSGGLVGFAADPIAEALAGAQKIMEGAWAVDSGAICLAHGGPFAEPEDTAARGTSGRTPRDSSELRASSASRWRRPLWERCKGSRATRSSSARRRPEDD